MISLGTGSVNLLYWQHANPIAKRSHRLFRGFAPTSCNRHFEIGRNSAFCWARNQQNGLSCVWCCDCFQWQIDTKLWIHCQIAGRKWSVFKCHSGRFLIRKEGRTKLVNLTWLCTLILVNFRSLYLELVMSQLQWWTIWLETVALESRSPQHWKKKPKKWHKGKEKQTFEKLPIVYNFSKPITFQKWKTIFPWTEGTTKSKISIFETKGEKEIFYNYV